MSLHWLIFAVAERSVHLSEIESERKRRGVNDVERLQQLLRKGAALEQELAHADPDQKVASRSCVPCVVRDIGNCRLSSLDLSSVLQAQEVSSRIVFVLQMS